MSQKNICVGTDYAVDFYLPEEATVVEVAFGLHNPNTEYERDIFKCLLAIDCGFAVKRLLFIAKPGALVKQDEPGRRAVAAWVKRHFPFDVDVVELKP